MEYTIDMSTIKNIHPGQIPHQIISEIVEGNRDINSDIASRLSKYFSNTSSFWLGLQNDFDLEESRLKKQLNFELELGENSGMSENFDPVKFLKTLQERRKK